MKDTIVLIKVDSRSPLGGFDTKYQLRKMPEYEWQKMNNGKLIEYNIASVEEGIKKAEELNCQLYENVVDLWWGPHETPLEQLMVK